MVKAKDRRQTVNGLLEVYSRIKTFACIVDHAPQNGDDALISNLNLFRLLLKLCFEMKNQH